MHLLICLVSDLISSLCLRDVINVFPNKTKVLKDVYTNFENDTLKKCATSYR